MLAELGSIIDQAYVESKGKGSSKKKVLFLIGNGISPVCNILNDEQIAKVAAEKSISTDPSTPEFQELKWRLFEYARYFTSNNLPSFSHACVFQLMRDGICQDLITTNYDLYFDGIWEKYPEIRVQQNPVLNDGDYSWEGYYTKKTASHKNPSYWKIHGSLSHIVFRGTHKNHWQVHRLPRFPISTNQPNLAEAYGENSLAPFLGYQNGHCAGTNFTHPSLLSPIFQPYIDWTYENARYMFAKEIEAVSGILTNTAGLAGIVLLGFRGYYNTKNPNDAWNEELVPYLLEIIDDATVPVFMAIHEKQAECLKTKKGRMKSELAVRMKQLNKLYPYPEAAFFMKELLGKNCAKFPYNTIKYEHSIWAKHWYLTMKEKKHA